MIGLGRHLAVVDVSATDGVVAVVEQHHTVDEVVAVVAADHVMWNLCRPQCL